MHILRNIGRIVSSLTSPKEKKYVECKVKYNTIAKIFSVEIDGEKFYPKKSNTNQLKTFKTWKILKLFLGKNGWTPFEETFKVENNYASCLFGKYASDEIEKYKGLK